MKDRVLRRARQQWLICEEVLSQDISRVSGEDVHLVPLQILASDVQEYYRRNLRRRFTNDRECSLPVWLRFSSACELRIECLSTLSVRCFAALFSDCWSTSSAVWTS
jgi:hypothetical protein